MSPSPNPYESPAAEKPDLVAEMVIDDHGLHVEFELTVEELLAYNDFYQARSRAARDTFRRAWAIRAVLYFCVGAIACFYFQRFAVDYALALSAVIVIVLVIAWFYYPFQYRRAIRRMMQRHYSEDNSEAVFGRRRASLTPAYFVISRRDSQTITRWQGVIEVCIQPSAIYVFVSSMQAHIIPRRAFADDSQFERFAQTAKDYHSRSRTVS